jgi:hypothetical protein
MRRVILLVTIAAVTVVAMLALAGTSFAEGGGSCFGNFAKAEPKGPGPGETFVRPVTEAAAPG